jgi:hypothetical protein
MRFLAGFCWGFWQLAETETVSEGFCRLGVFGVFGTINFNYMNLVNVLEAVCFVMGQDVERVKSKERYRHLVICRHLFYYLSKYYYGAKLREIGNITGNADHTSVIHGISVINDMISIKDEQIIKAVAEIQEYISKRYQADKKVSVFVPYNVNLSELAQLLQNNYGCRVIL